MVSRGGDCTSEKMAGSNQCRVAFKPMQSELTQAVRKEDFSELYVIVGSAGAVNIYCIHIDADSGSFIRTYRPQHGCV